MLIQRYILNRSYFDGRGAVARTFSNKTTANGWSTQDIEYDNMGRAFRVSNPYYATDGSEPINSAGFWTTSTFDRLGRVTEVKMPRGDDDNTLFSYVTTSYDGVYTTVTDQSGKTRRQKVDAMGRVIRLDEPTTSGLGSVTSPNQATTYEYDLLENLVHIDQGDQDRYFKYDALSRLIREKQVEQATNSSYNLSDCWNTDGTWTRKIEYNSSNLITHAYDARGVQTTFSYDDLNRVTTIDYSDSTPDAHYYYDSESLPSGAPSSSSPDLYTRSYTQGRLVAMTYGSGATGTYFDYDEMGRATKQFQITGSSPTKYKLTYGYNYAGLITSEVYPSGRAMSYSYDDGGRLRKVDDGTTTFADSLVYASHGGLTSETWGNSTVHELAYNRRMQASQIKLSKTVSGVTSILQQYDYGYGEFNTTSGAVDTSKNNGQIGKITGTIGTTAQWNQGFIYDELGRLSSFTEHSGSAMTTQNYAHSYTYDRYGNRRQATNSTLGLSAVTDSDYDTTHNNNRFVSSVAAYDEAGNITEDDKFRSLKYVYDANGRQSEVKLLNNTSIQTSVYDAAGQRVQTTAGNTTRTMVYDVFGQNVAEFIGASLDRENIYRGGQLLATEAGTPSAAAPSSLTASTNSSGTNISLSWSSASGASKYRVERKSAGGNFNLLTTTTGTSLTDSSVSNGSAYLYKICAADNQNNCTSSYSNLALGTAVSFAESIVGYSEDPSNATIIKALHITELRTAINAVRSLAGQSSGSWTYSVSTGSTIHVEDVRDLRTALDAALTALNIQTSSYTDNALVGYSENPLTATIIKAAHIRELRSRLSGVGTTSSGGSGAGLVYVLSDIQGSARAVMNNAGSSSSVIARHDYLPFGEEIGSGIGSRSLPQGYNATDGNRWKYGMTERDATSGLDHTWFRKYENVSGRWISPDPFGGSMNVANPQSFDRYTYTQNDPANFTDPSGLHFELNCHAEVRDISDPGGEPRLRFTGRSTCQLIWVNDGPYRSVDSEGGVAASLSPGNQKKYDKAKNKLLNRDLKKPSQKCAQLLALTGLSLNEITAAVNNQVAYSGPDSKGISMADAGLGPEADQTLPLDFRRMAETEANETVSHFFKRRDDVLAATATFRHETINNVFFRSSGLTDTRILHEALHSATGLADIPLAVRMGLGTFSSASAASLAINSALKKAGCTKD